MSNIMELIDDLVDWAVAKGDHPTTVEARAAVLEAVEKLEKGAARYQWLIDQHWVQSEVDWRLIATHQESTIKQLGEAIDAAMEATNGQGT